MQGTCGDQGTVLTTLKKAGILTKGFQLFDLVKMRVWTARGGWKPPFHSLCRLGGGWKPPFHCYAISGTLQLIIDNSSLIIYL